ncbi:MAG: hypothetical protein ACYDHE_17050 [Candidatus Acidiferrales bacterium]
MPRPAAPVNEAEVRARFVKAASSRTTRAIRALANVAKLPAKGRKAGDVPDIIAALEQALTDTRAHLSRGTTAEPEFKLK